jgi:hypothetical protein
MEGNICRLPVPISRSSRNAEATQGEVGEYWPEIRSEELNQAPLPFMYLEFASKNTG